MRGRPISPGMVRISRRCYDVLNLSWLHIGRLMDRDPCAIARAVKARRDFQEAAPDLRPVASLSFNPKSY
jgi:hypothetical protein